jgi:hypothetical protein
MNMADPEKKARSARKSALTRAINDIHQGVAEEDKDLVTEKLSAIKEKFWNFEAAHDAYHDKLEDEDAMEVSETYFTDMHQKYIKVVKEAKQWLKSLDVKPEVPVQAASPSTAEMMKMLNLPRVELRCFSGDPLQYYSFLSLFDEHVHSAAVDDSVKLAHLLQYTDGKAQQAIQSCITLGGTAGYLQAREILRERFGDDFLIAEKAISSLKAGKPVKSSEDLTQLADDLKNCLTTLSSMKRVSEIDTQSNIIEIASRLQQYIRNRWKRFAMEMKEKKKRYPNFEEFVGFVSKEANEAADPVYGQWGSKPKSPEAKTFKPSYSSSSFATVARSSETRHTHKKYNCLLCGGEHRLLFCNDFKGMKLHDRVKYVKENKLCENCLWGNHVVTDCRKDSCCTVPGCGQRHTRYLHVNDSHNQENATHTEQSSVTNASVNADVNVLLPIVPVLVNNKHSTHALLDNASTNTYCSQALVDELEIEGKSES